MGGVDAIHGIAYQQAQAVLLAVDLFEDARSEAIRVEGVDDVVDIEFLNVRRQTVSAWQVKTRLAAYTWSQADLRAVIERWLKLEAAREAPFEFLTNGRLGPSAEDLVTAIHEGQGDSLDRMARLFPALSEGDLQRLSANLRIRVDPTPVTALLLRAERQVASMLPDVRSVADAQQQAAAAIDRLYRSLFERSSQRDSAARIVSRDELASLLGIPADWVGVDWSGALRPAVVAAAQTVEVQKFVDPRLAIWAVLDRDESGDLGVSDILNQPGHVVVAGRAGSGKSTVVALLRAAGPSEDWAVLHCHAESFLPGRLDAMASDAISESLGREIPASAGRQALNDTRTVLAVDGASEVPPLLADALRADLHYLAQRSRAAKIILLGRDVATTRRLLPSSAPATSLLLHPLDASGRAAIAQRCLDARVEVTETLSAAVLTARVEVLLGEASGNPLLFTMGCRIVLEGRSVGGRADVYRLFIEYLAERAGAVDVATAAAALGVVFSGLLDQGRRYADPHEYRTRLAAACEVVGSEAFPVDPVTTDDTARTSGLLATVGFGQTVTALHDSFADFLAGSAAATSLVHLPDRLYERDDPRVLFACEVGGIEVCGATRLARDRPFLTVAAATYDGRRLEAGAPEYIEEILSHLLPLNSPSGVHLWRHPNGTVIAAPGQASSGWISGPEGELLLSGTAIVAGADDGPLAIAVRIWRLALTSVLDAVREPWPRERPTSQEDAVTAVRDHAHEVASAAHRLVEAISSSASAAELVNALPPLGMTALVHPETDGLEGPSFPVTYSRSQSVEVASTAAAPSRQTHTGHTTTNGLLRATPISEAADLLRDTVNRLTGTRFL